MRLSRWILHPAARTTVFVLLLLGFAVLVGFYFVVVGQSVRFAVRIYATSTAEPGSTAAMRVWIYRPDSLLEVRGFYEVEQLDGNGSSTLLSSSSLSTALPVPINVAVPNDIQDSVSLNISVQRSSDPETRVVPIELPLVQAESWMNRAELRHNLSVEASGVGSAGEAATIRRIRTEPPDAEIKLTVVAEGGVPVRFLDNRLLVRVAEPDGTPLANEPVEITFPPDAGLAAVHVQTDSLGLAEFTAQPTDIEMWRFSLLDRGVDVLFEIVPSWDGVICHINPIVPPAGFRLAFDTNSTSGWWHYDLFTDGMWLSTGTYESRRHRVWIGPGDDLAWAMPEDRIRLGVIQVHTRAIMDTSHMAVRAFILRPESMTQSEALTRLLNAFLELGIEQEFIAALQASGVLDENLPDEQLDRLAQFLLARFRPAAHAPEIVFDDADAQIQMLNASVGRFRSRAHWLLGLGVATLLCWITARVVLTLVATRRRTRIVLDDLDDPDIQVPFDVGSAAIVWITIAFVTVGIFFLGVLYLLASM